MKLTKENEPIYKKSNGTYMMTRELTGELNYWCGFPDDPNGCHADVETYLSEHPEALIQEPTPPEPTAEEKASIARRHRDELLAACDWTQIADAPVDQATWRLYRQTLRDWPESIGFPDIATMPEAPKK